MSQRAGSDPQSSVKSVSLLAGRKIPVGVSQHKCVYLSLSKTHTQGLLQHPQPAPTFHGQGKAFPDS